MGAFLKASNDFQSRLIHVTHLFLYLAAEGDLENAMKQAAKWNRKVAEITSGALPYIGNTTGCIVQSSPSIEGDSMYDNLPDLLEVEDSDEEAGDRTEAKDSESFAGVFF